MKIVTKFLLLTSVVSVLTNNIYSSERNNNNNEQYTFIEGQDSDSTLSSEINEQINNNQHFNYKCLLDDEEYIELNNVLGSISMPFQFVNDFTMITSILDCIKKNCNITDQQFKYYSEFLHKIYDNRMQLIGLVTNPNNTNTKCYKPLSNVVTSLIKSFESFYRNVPNCLWIRVILSDSSFNKYTKNITINQNLVEKIKNKSINDIFKYFEEVYGDYYDFF